MERRGSLRPPRKITAKLKIELNKERAQKLLLVRGYSAVPCEGSHSLLQQFTRLIWELFQKPDQDVNLNTLRRPANLGFEFEEVGPGQGDVRSPFVAN